MATGQIWVCKVIIQRVTVLDRADDVWSISTATFDHLGNWSNMGQQGDHTAGGLPDHADDVWSILTTTFDQQGNWSNMGQQCS